MFTLRVSDTRDAIGGMALPYPLCLFEHMDFLPLGFICRMGMWICTDLGQDIVEVSGVEGRDVLAAWNRGVQAARWTAETQANMTTITSNSTEPLPNIVSNGQRELCSLHQQNTRKHCSRN